MRRCHVVKESERFGKALALRNPAHPPRKLRSVTGDAISESRTLLCERGGLRERVCGQNLFRTKEADNLSPILHYGALKRRSACNRGINNSR